MRTGGAGEPDPRDRLTTEIVNALLEGNQRTETSREREYIEHNLVRKGNLYFGRR